MYKLLLAFAIFLIFISGPIYGEGNSSQYKTGDIDLPYIERGELKNTLPSAPIREPSPAERVIKEVYEAPIRPTVIDKKPGVEYHYPNR